MKGEIQHNVVGFLIFKYDRTHRMNKLLPLYRAYVLLLLKGESNVEENLRGR